MIVPYPFLFGISGGEVLILLLLVLLLFGPKKIPEIARMIGRGMNEVKKVQREINTEIHRYSSDIEREAKEMESEIKKLADDPASKKPALQKKSNNKDPDKIVPEDEPSSNNTEKKEDSEHGDVDLAMKAEKQIDEQDDNDLPYPYGRDRAE